MDGALLVNKHQGVSSFGVIEDLQHILMRARGVRKRDLPKMGHGGTLDPFATGMLTVCVGRGVKLARYFLGANKIYEGRIRFGETTIPGDPTAPVSERSAVIPVSLEVLREAAHRFTLQDYLQTPPMHSAKKKDGKPLYELARAGIEIDREPKLCKLYSFEILSYEAPLAEIRVTCSSGTYIRTLAQDFAKVLGTLGLLETLHRSSSGFFPGHPTWTVAQISEATEAGKAWNELPCWMPFDRLLDGYPSAQATSDEAESLMDGKQGVLPSILGRTPVGENTHLAIQCGETLVAVAKREGPVWELERVFLREF